MNRVNYVAKALVLEHEFIADINQATQAFFNDELCEVLHKDNKRVIKAYRDEANAVIYIFDQRNQKIEVMLEDIHDFNKDRSIKEILHWDICFNKNKTESLYKYKIFVCHINQKKHKILKNMTEKEFEDALLKNTPKEGQSVLLSLIANFKTLFGKAYFKNKDFLSEFGASIGLCDEVEYAMDVSVIQQYTQFLHKQGHMPTEYGVAFFKALTKDAFKSVQKYISDWAISMNAMVKACINHKFLSYKNAFVFNDLDNRVFIHNGQLVLTDQNVGFYFDKVDDANFTIYFFEKECSDVNKELARITHAIKDNSINELKDIYLKVVEGNVVMLNDAYTYCFEIDIKYSVIAMETENVLKVEYPVDVTSYEYQKNYCCHVYNLSEFEFIAYAMMTLGGGFDYDKVKGTFVDRCFKYIADLPKAPNTRNKPVKSFSYLWPKEGITYLNADWLDALKYAVNVLKKDRPEPAIFNGEDAELAMNEAIQYFEGVIAQLEKE